MKPGKLLGLILILTLTAGFGAEKIQLSADYADGQPFMGITFKGSLRLDGIKLNGMNVEEMSGLAWSGSSNTLYGISNDARLFHLKPVFDERGFLVDLTLAGAYMLRDKNGKALTRGFRDSEGLILLPHPSSDEKENAESLLVSFETKHRVEEYSVTGEWIQSYQIPPELLDRNAFYNSNSGMESIVRHPALGLLTATERSLSSEPDGHQLIYSLDSNQRWSIPLSKVKDGAVVALEVMRNGDLLMLERAYSSMLEPLVVSLYKIPLTPECLLDKGADCERLLLAQFSTAEGWAIDNFEGLARHQNDGYFMISDNNKMWFQKTLLSYFEVNTPKELTSR